MGTVFDGNWDESKVGIIPRALREIFQTAKEVEGTHIVNISCSFFELYQEQVYDLLTAKPRDKCICDIREDGSKGIIISGLSEVPASDVHEALEYLVRGGNSRTTGSTAMNDVSSRSHAIFTVNVAMTNIEDETKTNAKFHLVDLAGSERSKKTLATGTRFKEGVKINQGLLALGNVISALGGGTQNVNYISYRDSKLTRLLQDSLGGNSVTLMVACVSPADFNIEETLGTLRYADRAKKIKNKPIKNEDSHSMEVSKLKQTIQNLRMQLINHGIDVQDKESAKLVARSSGSIKGAVTKLVCPPECKTKMEDKDKQIFDLKSKLNAIICSMNELNALHLIDDNFINEFITAYEAFRDKILSTCSAEFAMPDTKIFDEIREKADEIQKMIKNYKSQLDESHNEEKLKIPEPDDVDNKKYTDFTNNQIAFFSQINDLERQMKIKQQLLENKNKNVPMMLDETTADKTMAEYEETIRALERELEDLRSEKASSNVRRDHNATKVNMDRKHKIEKLEKDLTELRKKCAVLEKNKKIAEQDRKRIEDLKREIEEMKKTKVALIRQQRSESEMYKRFISNRDKEINCLKEKSRKAQNEMKRKERLHEKQQAVLKRKVEEAKAISKRLQEISDKNKKIKKEQQEKTSEKRMNIVQDYMDHEIDAIHSSIDAKNTMQSLMNDRGLLLQRLQNLKATVQKTPDIENEIKQLEEDLEMRSAQITDMRGKLAETDIEAKLKNIPENFSTVPELRIAMGYVLRALAEARENFNSNKTKTEELKAAYEASEERVEFLVEENAEIQKLYEEEKSQMERNFEQKITLLYQKTKGELDKNEEEKCFSDMAEQLSSKFDENELLKKRIKELEEEIKTKNVVEGTDHKKKPKKESNILESTFDVDDDLQEVDDDDDEEDFNLDDSFNDPDWKKTPQFKNKRTSRATTTLLKESIVNRLDGTGMLINISETSDTSIGTKRNSAGNTKCTCRGSCATKLCGCKKNSNYCSSSCRCGHACLNQPNVSKESNDGNDGANATTTHEKENEKTPEKRESR